MITYLANLRSGTSDRHRATSFLRLALMGLMLTLAGCAMQSPDGHPGATSPGGRPAMSDEELLATLSRRAAQIQRLSSQAVVQLRSAHGRGDDTVQFDAVLIAQVPDRLRIAASKLNRTVFDLAAAEGEVFLRLGSDLDDEARAELRTVASSIVAPLLDVLTLRFFARPDLRIVQSREDSLTVAATLSPDLQTAATIDRHRAVMQQLCFRDRAGRSLATITLSGYERGDLVAPRVVIASEQGDIALWLDRTKINPELPPRAFLPPAQAIRLIPTSTDP